MAEKQRSQNDDTAPNRLEAQTNEQGNDEATARRSTVPCRTVKFPGGNTVSLELMEAWPDSPERTPEEPMRRVPVVPPGEFRPDTDDSPPVKFDDVDDDTGAEYAVDDESRCDSGTGDQ